MFQLLKDCDRERKIKYQLVPPASHCDTAGERSIQVYENHLKAGLATGDRVFPIR